VGSTIAQEKTVNVRYPFEPLSIWVDEPLDLQRPVEGDVNADVVIAGGGLTGLSTALELRAMGVDVALVEKSFCGSGSSGRNAGHLTPSIGKDIPTILKMFGEEKAKRLLHFAESSIEHTLDVMERYAIDCDFVPNGNVIAAVHSKQEAQLERAAKTAADLGANVEFLDANHLRQKDIPRAFTAGIWERLGGVLHPGKYVLGLRAAALNAGVRIYENSPMIRVEEGSKVTVHCEHGSICADEFVQATNAYTNGTGRLKRMVFPMRVTLFETTKLTAEQMSRLGWSGKQGIYTAHEMLENFRLTEYGTLQGGSKIVRAKYGGALAEGYDEPTFEAMTQIFRDRFPELADVEIAKWWGGWIGLTTNFLPKIGTNTRRTNMHHAIGYNGHGIPQATMSGRLIADRIAGNENPYGDLFGKLGFAWPPEPLTWLANKTLTGVMGVVDRRIDKAIRQSSK
jgi:glycine/D-amino acid oxidase-like deaminating enzyme